MQNTTNAEYNGFGFQSGSFVPTEHLDVVDIHIPPGFPRIYRAKKTVCLPPEARLGLKVAHPFFS